VLAAVLEFQRDMISKNTREGVAAAEASGKTPGRPAAVSAEAAGRIVAAYLDRAVVINGYDGGSRDRRHVDPKRPQRTALKATGFVFRP
jgi:DNA invertase Pin-like site-specific DNA recombinase